MKSHVLSAVKWVLLLTLVPICSSAQIRTSVTSVAVSPAFTNHYSQVDLTFNVTNPNGAIVAGQDSIRITFPAGFSMPASIDPSNISMGGVTLVGSVHVYGSSIAFITPISMGNGASAIIRVLNTAKVRNPSVSGSHTISVLSGNTYTATSPSFTINQSTTTVSSGAVTPNPSVEFFPAQYTVSFQLGAGGYLAQDQKIYLAFPIGTIIPDGFLSGVKVNGTNAVTLKSGNSLEINAPSFYDNNQFIQVLIPKSSGLRNPDSDNTPFVIGVSTESETTVVQTATYSISPVDQLSFSAVSASPDTVNQMAGYSVSFYTGVPGNLDAATDYIEFTFPPNTLLPANLNTSKITISNSEGFTDNPTAVVRVSDTVVRLQTPVNIDSGTEVTVAFQSSLGIKNPSKPANFQLTARTIRPDLTDINGATSSNPYAIFSASTTLERPNVTLSTTNQNVSANYTINTKVGLYGGLAQSLNTITLKFPTGTNLGTISSATINSVAIPAGNRVVSNSTTLTITLPTGVNIANSGSITLVINGITNPANGGYSLIASSNAEPTEVLSSDYTIGGTSFTINSAPNVSPQNVNSTASYALYGLNNSGTYNRNNNDYIRVSFPEGVIIPSTMAPSDITLSADNGAYVSAVVTNSTNRLATVYLDKNAGGNSSFAVYNLTFNASAGIINPSIPSTNTDNPTVVTDNYRIRVSSSRKTNYATTPTFNIQPTNSATLAINSVVVTPNVKNADNVVYSFRITPTAVGRLKGGTNLGSNYIRIFTYGSILDVPGTINPAHVTVNGISASRVDVVNGNQITVFIPDGVTLEPGVEAEVRFGSEIGLRNVNWSGNPGFAMKTDNSYTQTSGNFTILNTANLPLTFDEITLSTNQINAASAYTIRFKLGTSDAIAQGDLIKITFPDNTYVPSSIAKSRILVNSLNPLANTTLEGTRTLVFQAPDNYSAGQTVSVLISTNAGLLNPSFVASNHTASVLLANASTATSSTYTTTAASSTVSIANVELSKTGEPNPAAPSLVTDYTVRFNTGENGRLQTTGSPRSTITITFPSATQLPAAASSAITVNGVAVPLADRTINNTSKTVTVVVPSSLTITNNASVAVYIPNVTNPATAASNYTVFVKTSIEPTNIESNTYSISNNGPVTFISAVNTNNIVNQDVDFTIRFSTTATLTAGTDRIILEFPEDIGFKGQIPTGSITLSVYPTAAFATPSNTYSFLSTDFVISPNSNTITARTGIAIPANSYVQVHISNTSNIRNPREPGTNYSFKVATTQQSFRVGVSNLEFIPSVITNISNLTVARSTTQLNTPTTWTWRFTTGSNGGLKPGLGSIVLIYLDNNISVPANINTASVTVNYSRPQSINVTGNTIRLTIPASVTIGSNASVEVVISGDAGVIEVPPSSAAPSITENINKSSKKANSGNNSSPKTTAEGYEAYTSSEPTAQNVGAALPVELVSFTADVSTNSSKPVITWKTSSESENYGFKIERSVNSGNWELLDFVQGVGYSSETTTYTITDATITVAGTYRYRLTQIDFDGTETVFDTIEVLVEAPNKTELIGNYPNPFNPQTTIAFNLSKPTTVQVEVYDVLGRLVQTLADRSFEAGKFTLSFNGANYASGVYFIRFKADAKVSIKKMLLIK
ncbi:T9SS type A sorting domain-containing protein [bacterium]|nr:MAG: T9SS type A sorting domain-containing protein [bacterium]